MSTKNTISFLFSIGILLISTSGLSAMPAHPSVITKHASRGTLGQLAARSQAMHARNAARPASRFTRIQKRFPSSGSRRIPVLVIGYSDLGLNTISNKFFYENLFNNSGMSMKKYFADMSGGKLDLTIDVHLVGNANHSVEYYGQNTNDFDARPASLVGEAVDKAEAAGIDWTLYDNDNDGSVDLVMVIHAGAGEEFSDEPNHIWSHAWTLNGAKASGDGTGARSYDGKTINAYTIQPEYNLAAGDSTIGVFCHEFCHKLGLPDQYDTSYETQGVGQFSIMASGVWLGPGQAGSRPAPLLAWERALLGWVQLAAPSSLGTVIAKSSTSSESGQKLSGGTMSGAEDQAGAISLLLALTVSGIVIGRKRLREPVQRTLMSLIVLGMIGSFGACSDDEVPIPEASARYQVTLHDIEDSLTALRIPLGDPAQQQDYLVEYKVKKTGTWTEFIPGTGLLVCRIHQGVIDALLSANAINTGAKRIHGVTVVEADNDGMLWLGRDLDAGTKDYSDSGRQEDLFVTQSLGAKTQPASFWHTATAAPWSRSGTRISAAGISEIDTNGPSVSCICSLP